MIEKTFGLEPFVPRTSIRAVRNTDIDIDCRDNCLFFSHLTTSLLYFRRDSVAKVPAPSR
jgi:hypothetical protein